MKKLKIKKVKGKKKKVVPLAKTSKTSKPAGGTGGAGKGSTTVNIGSQPPPAKGKTGTSKVGSKTGKSLLGKAMKRLSKSKNK